MTSTQRALTILRRLMRRGCTVRELVELVGERDEKTIRRDLIAIRKAGFRLRAKVENIHGRKRYRVK